MPEPTELPCPLAVDIWDGLRDLVQFLYNFKNMKNIHGGMLLLVKLQAKAYNFTKNNTLPLVFFTFSKLHKRYQIS